MSFTFTVPEKVPLLRQSSNPSPTTEPAIRSWPFTTAMSEIALKSAMNEVPSRVPFVFHSPPAAKK